MLPHRHLALCRLLCEHSKWQLRRLAALVPLPWHLARSAVVDLILALILGTWLPVVFLGSIQWDIKR